MGSSVGARASEAFPEPLATHLACEDMAVWGASTVAQGPILWVVSILPHL